MTKVSNWTEIEGKKGGLFICSGVIKGTIIIILSDDRIITEKFGRVKGRNK